MDVTKAIDIRRAYRSLEPVEITEDLIQDLARHAQLSPSCTNNQPWRLVFVYDPEKLKEMHAVLSPGNEWIQAEWEKTRPERFPLEKFVHRNTY